MRQITFISMAHVIQIHSQLPTRQVTFSNPQALRTRYSQLPTRQVTCSSLFDPIALDSQLPTRQVTIKVAKLIYIIKKQIQFYPYFYMLAQRVLLSTAYNEDINKG